MKRIHHILLVIISKPSPFLKVSVLNGIEMDQNKIVLFPACLCHCVVAVYSSV